MIARLQSRVRAVVRHPRTPVLAAVAAATAVAAVVAGVLTRDGGPGLGPAPAFALSPSGDEVGRLEPVRVTFERAPSEQDGSRILAIAPAVDGQYAWLNDRTLLFQPDYPGYLRGFEYTVRVAAQPDAGLPAAQEARFRTAGKLAVVSTIPADGDEDVPEKAQILVQFTRSVAPLTLLAARDAAPVLAIDPPLRGTGEWLNTSLYRFVPDRLEPNTQYTVTIAAGLSSAADGVLEADYRWRFRSFGPALIRVTPDQQTQYAGPRQQVTFEFNQPMVKSAVERAFSLKQGEAAVGGSFAWNAAGTVVTFTPSAALAPLASHAIALPAGLPGARGGATLFPWESTFQTVGPLGLARTEPAAGSTSAQRYGLSLTFTHPIDIDSLEGKVSISGIEWENPGPTYADELQAYYYASLEPSTRYVVTIAAGIRDRYGQTMPATSFSFTTAPLNPSLNLATPGYVGNFAASREPILYYQATNTATASFTLWPLTKSELGLYLSEKGWPPGGFVPSQAPIRSWTETVSGPADEVLVRSTSLSGGGPLPKGDYLVRPSGLRGYPHEFAFSVIDTNIVLKKAHDELIAWALDYETGEPVAGAIVGASGPGLLAPTATTNADGLASFPLVSAAEAGPYGERQYAVTLGGGGRYGVASTTWQRGAYPYELGLPLEYYPRRYKGHIYTDRPIYRPGETVEFKAIVREDDDARYRVPEDRPPIDVVVTDPKGTEVLRAPVELNEHGSFAVSLRLGEEAATGDYRAWLSWSPPGPNSDKAMTVSITGTSFLVAEFVRPEFEVKVTPDAAVYANGETISATARASFFFGGNLADASVEWAVLARPTSIRNEKYRRYSFSDYDYWRYIETSSDPVRARGEGVTDASGEFVFTVPATLLADDGPHEFTLAATVTDENAQAVSGSTTVTVHQADRYAGVRSASWLASAGDEVALELVTLTKEGDVAPNTPVRVEVYKRRWVTTKVQTAEGARQYRSEPVDELVTTVEAVTGTNGEGTARFTAPSAGTLRVVAVVRDAAGREARAATYVWCWGGADASWRVTNDDLVKLVADRDEYAPGDTAEVLVPTPFAGAIGLVTVERGKVHSREVREFATTAERLRIPLGDGSIPNVFVAVVLYRPPTADDPVPRYKVGYAKLTVSTESRRLNVSIRPDVARAQPGETVSYTIEVKDWQGNGVQAELSVAVVDKAVLSLEAERAIDGLRAFWFERGLGVQTSSSLAVSVNRSNDAIPAPEAGGKGGGGFDEDLLRKEFRNTAYWEAQVQTDARGVARVSVPLPDNLTTWRLQARAISGDILVGEATNELVSTRPLLVRPALPRFLRVGDEVQLRALVTSNAAATTVVTVGIEAEGIVLEDGADREVTVGPRASAVVTWPASVVAAGTAAITLRAVAADGTQDGVRVELPVHLDLTPEAVATNGVVTGDPALEAVYLPGFAILENGSLDIAVQPTLVGFVAGELGSFLPRPPEQESPADVASRLIAFAAVLRASPPEAPAAVASIDRLRSDVADLLIRQHADGGWSWCVPLCSSDPLLTSWSLLALGEAARAGVSVDPASVERADAFLSSHLNRLADVEHPIDPNERAMYLYALAVAGRAQAHAGEVRAVFEQYRAQLVPSGRAYLLMALHELGAKATDRYVSQLLNDLVTTVEPSANGNHWEDGKRAEGERRGLVRTPAQATALVLTALSRVQPGHPLIEETVRWLTVSRSTQRWEYEPERAQAVLALAEFAASTGELGASFAYEVKLAGQRVLEGSFDAKNPAATDAKSVPLADLEKGKVSLVEFIRRLARGGRLYYKLDLRYLTPAKEIEALNRGFAVSHEYSLLDEPGRSVGSAHLGDVVRVKVTVVTTQERNYVLVRDSLPAGLEPIDPRLDTVDPVLVSRLDEERRDLVDAGGYAPKYWAPWYRWYYSPWRQVDIRDEVVELRTDSLPAGVHEYVYYARATTPGSFFVAPVHAEEGLFPEVFGRSDSGTFVIE